MFNDAEMEFIKSQPLVRLATATPSGRPHVVPSRFLVEGDHILVVGWEMARSYKYRQVEQNPWVALVWDAVIPGPPLELKGVEMRGTARIVTDPDPKDEARKAYIEVTPTKVFSWGVNEHIAVSFSEKMGYPPDHPILRQRPASS